MANIIIPPEWHIPDREATPESVYFNRRAFIKSAGLGIAAAGLGACGQDFAPIPIDDNQLLDGNCDASPPAHPLQTICPSPSVDLYPASRNRVYQTPPSDLTDRLVAATYNNFYEFIGGGFGSENTIWPFVGPLTVWPWTVEVAGEAEVTGTFDVSDLEREIGLEERVYRHRCVERWSMVVPWTGYPLARLIEKFRPLSSANYVRFVGFNRPNEAVGQRIPGIYPWPYYEALRMDEALNELAFMVTGIFGEPLPKQHGAPWRLALPWKYGFKGPKSIVRIEFMREQPPTFWPDVWSDEYGFYSNVNPDVPHPRWSQRWENPIGTNEQRETKLFNGYASQVADLYDSDLLTYIS